MNTADKSSRTITKSAATVSVAIMCSRVLGLVREQVFAWLFGAGTAYDAYVVAFRIPNLLRDLFGEGALSAAFVAVFSDYNANRTREQTWKLASNVLCFFCVVVSLIVILAMLFSGPIVSTLAPNFDSVAGKSELTRTMTIIMMPFLLFISLAAVLMGILNTRGHFFIPSLASAFFNLGSIIGGVTLAYFLPSFGYPPILGMAFGTLIGGFLQLIVQVPSLKRAGFKFIPTLQIKDPGLIRILKLMVPATIGLSATQVNIFINTIFASSCAEGSVSWLSYAFRLVQLPIGLFGVAISIAALPVLAKQASQNNIEEMKQTFVSSLTLVFGLTIPATIGLIMLSEPIIRLIFEHGAFTESDTRATATALSLFATGLFAYAANKVIVPVYYAINAARYPVIGSFIAIGVNILIVTSTIDAYQHRAIALSTSATMVLNFLFLATVLYVKTGGYSLGYLIRGLAKILLASLVMGIALGATSSYLGGLNASIWGQLLYLGLLIPLCAALYGFLLHVMKLKELSQITDRVWQRLKPAK